MHEGAVEPVQLLQASKDGWIHFRQTGLEGRRMYFQVLTNGTVCTGIKRGMEPKQMYTSLDDAGAYYNK